MNTKSRVIVFGGAGFVGSHVSDALSRDGHEVTIFDKKNSPYLQDNQNIIIGDTLDYDVVFDAVKEHDVVYNFSGIADIEEAQQDPVTTVKVNILGNTHILDAAAKNNVKRFIFASSLYVLSQAGSFYRSSKQACELIIENYHKVYGLPYTVLRYGSLYGPRGNSKNWIHSVLKQAIIEKKITRLGNGEEIREYIHVLDAAKGSVEILSPEFQNQHIIISGYQTIKIKDLLTMIIEILGEKIEVEYKPTDSDQHYKITPYSFNPRLGRKLVSRQYIDIGQGLLDSINEIYHNNISNIYEDIIIKTEKEI